MNWLIIILLFVLPNEVKSAFNKHFAGFVENNYGKQLLDALQRSDLGDSGSFGGKTNEMDDIKNDPIVFVHGVSDLAGGKMQALAASYRKNGYTSGELYATSYDDGPKNNPLSWSEYSLKCEHVKRIRTLILAVRYYTLRNVDIIAYSFGVPLTRKAVLGGICVDTKEDLGAPLTSYIDSFVGVAGPNHGISFQVSGISIPGCVIGAIPILPICSKIIGLYSGFCPVESAFLTDINENSHYEGRYVYSIYTENDSWIGYRICDQITARIPGEDGHKLYKQFSHDDVVLRTCEMQLQMIQFHSSHDSFNKTLAKTRLRLSRQVKPFLATNHRRKPMNDDYNVHSSDYSENQISKLQKMALEKTTPRLQSSFSEKIAEIAEGSLVNNNRNEYDDPKFKRGSKHRIQDENQTTSMVQQSFEKRHPKITERGGFHTHINVSFE